MVVIRGAVKAQRSLPFVEPDSEQVLKRQYRGSSSFSYGDKWKRTGEHSSLVLVPTFLNNCREFALQDRNIYILLTNH